MTLIQIGLGGRGYDRSIPECPVCWAFGGGGHGGYCPNGGGRPRSQWVSDPPDGISRPPRPAGWGFPVPDPPIPEAVNWSGVGLDGRGIIHIAVPLTDLTTDEALMLAAWLAELADPQGDRFNAIREAVHRT